MAHIPILILVMATPYYYKKKSTFTTHRIKEYSKSKLSWVSVILIALLQDPIASRYWIALATA